MCTSVASPASAVIQRYFHGLFFFNEISTLTKRIKGGLLKPSQLPVLLYLSSQVKSNHRFAFFYVFQEPKGWSKKSPLRTYNGQVEAEVVVHISKFFCAIPAACLAITSVCLQRQQRHVFASLSSATTISLGIFLTGA